MPLVPQDWPPVPEAERGKRKLYISENLENQDLEYLSNLGWKVVDVRLLPQGDRKAAVEAKLEGINMGSIQASKQQLEALELEMRALKMLLQKDSGAQVKGDQDVPQDALAALSSIGSNRAGLDLEELGKKLKAKRNKPK